jgi:uncharacterized protein (TIGR00255 family)
MLGGASSAVNAPRAAARAPVPRQPLPRRASVGVYWRSSRTKEVSLITSMTGYGRAEAAKDGVRLEIEIRSVNNRFLDLAIRLPRALSPLEGKVKEIVQSEVARGRVNVSVSLDEASAAAEEIDFDPAVAEATIAFLKKMKKQFRLAGEIEVGTLAAFPEIVKRRKKEWSEEELWPLAEKLLRKALKDFNAMRATEGKALAADLRKRVALLDRELDRIEKRSPKRALEAKEALRRRVNELLKSESMQISEERLAAEVAILVDRMDCTEEVVRFRSHNAQFLECLDDGEAVGKRLNFLLQEMNREANTIGSKANDAEVARGAILLKEETEKIREQIQNIE